MDQIVMAYKLIFGVQDVFLQNCLQRKFYFKVEIFFKGENDFNQLSKIFYYCGTPN